MLGKIRNSLLQFCVFGFRCDEDGNVRVGVFPQREEILIRRLGFGGVALLRPENERQFCPETRLMRLDWFGVDKQSSVRQLLLQISQNLPLLGREVTVPTGLNFSLPCIGWYLAQGSYRILYLNRKRFTLFREPVGVRRGGCGRYPVNGENRRTRSNGGDIAGPVVCARGAHRACAALPFPS